MIQRLLSRWNAERLAQVAERVAALEKTIDLLRRAAGRGAGRRADGDRPGGARRGKSQSRSTPSARIRDSPRSARRTAAGRSCRAGRGCCSARSPSRRSPLCATRTLRPSMSPSWRSSAARSASTGGVARRLGRCRRRRPGLPARARASAWRTLQALGDDFAGHRFGVGRRGDGPRMAHADIASQ